VSVDISDDPGAKS
jgi:hypothetical protein